MIKLPQHKTKIICTIGPASRSPAMIERLIKSGMNIARLNFSHSENSEHKENIHNIRKVSQKLKIPVSILIDLPGVKMRIGDLKEPLMIKRGEKLTLTTKSVLGTQNLISVSYKRLPHSVSKGSIIYLNDGFIQLKVEKVSETNIDCRIVVGGKLLSHKGLNLPGAKVFVDPITPLDLKFIKFGLEHGVTTFGLSFIETAKDIVRVREFARKLGRTIYLVAKIERREAIKNFTEILKVTDAVMIARGDLGVEIPLEEVPVVQKRLIREANIVGVPVITATQMMGSMTQNIRPTRAEVNDVANAILDGTDAVMLSEETAIGSYPVDVVKTMARIAVATEHLYLNAPVTNQISSLLVNNTSKIDEAITDTISVNAVEAVAKLKAKCVLTQTSSGTTARHISRFKPHCWILAFSAQKEICEFLNFSYGVRPYATKPNFKYQPHVLLEYIRKIKLVQKGDTVVVIGRRFSTLPGQTDSLGVVVI